MDQYGMFGSRKSRPNDTVYLKLQDRSSAPNSLKVSFTGIECAVSRMVARSEL